MSRTLVAAALIALLVVPSIGATAAAANDGVTIDVPSVAETFVSTAFEFRLPKTAAAVDGRLFFDTEAADFVGLAPLGGGEAFMPESFPGGVAFGAYGLRSHGGQTVMRVILAPKSAGQIDLKLVIDSAADKAGNALKLRGKRADATLGVAGGNRHFEAPDATNRPSAERGAGPVRSLTTKPVISQLDVDTARAGWELARARNSLCDAEIAVYADANGDGCVDIVDVQAVVAAKGRPAAESTLYSSVAAQPKAVDTRFTASLDFPLPEALATTSAASSGPNFTVDSTSDTPDANIADGVCADSLNRCTLRAAIQSANNWLGDNRIDFNIPGSGPFTITIGTSPLPLINDRGGATIIDGYTQPGSTPNTAAFGSNAVIRIRVVGPGTTSSSRNPFRVLSSANVIRGLAFTNFNRAIMLDGPDATHNRIIGNWLGFNTDGTPAASSGGYNVLLNTGASDNLIGTPALADRNVSGRATTGIMHYGPSTWGNIIQNNLLCATPTGTNLTTAGCTTGIDHDHGPKYGLIGGTDPSMRNIIGRTSLNGIEYSHGWDPDGPSGATDPTWQVAFNMCIGNWVGFRHNGAYDATFRSAQNDPGTGDNGNGINAYDGSSHNLIEGNYVASVWDGIQTMSSNATDNTIRNNIIGVSPLGQAAPVGRWGIAVRENTRTHLIEGNIISNANTGGNNTGGGIGLRQPDVRFIKITRNIITNTPGPAIYLAPYANDPSSGANNLLASPVITSATTVRVAGTGMAGATVEVYRADRPAGQNGLPIAYIGSATIANNGTWQIQSSLSVGQIATALQITPNQDTSQLAINSAVTAEQPPAPPVADFSWGQRAASLTVDFTDTSTGSPTSWSWDFGDSTSSTQQNPTKTYSAAGNYTVKLTATNFGGSDTRTKQITVVDTPPPVGGLFAADAFSRTTNSSWGSADIGGAYSVQGTATNFNVAAGVGSMVVPTAGVTRSALLNNAAGQDVDIKFRLSADKVAAGAATFVYAVARRNNASNSEYRPRILLNANGTISVHASRLLNGTETPLGSAVVVAGLTQAADSFIWVRAQVQGSGTTTIRVKAWADGQSEPAGWQYTTTDTSAGLQSAGSLGLRIYAGAAASNAPITFHFDDYSAAGFPPPPPVSDFSYVQQSGTLTVDFTDTSTGSPTSWSWDFGDSTSSTQQNPTKTYSAAGNYTVKLTATNIGGSDTRTRQITVAPLPQGTTYAADAFSRTTNSSWGSADIGGAYSVQGTATNFNVAAGVGSMVVPTAGVTRSALLNNAAGQDVDIKFRLSADKVAAGAATFVYAVARRNNASNSEYRPRILLNANGTISVHASRLLNGTETPLGSAVVVAGLTQAADSFIWVRAQVQGSGTTTIRVKAWADGQSEPAGWQYTTTDTSAGLQSAGSLGLRIYAGAAASNAPITFHFDDYLVKSIP